MRTFEFTIANVKENLTCIRACLIKAVEDGDNGVCLFSALFFVKENFDRVKAEIKAKTKDLCQVKSSRPKIFYGYKMYGMQIHFLSDDRDLLKSRLLDIFNGSFTSQRGELSIIE